MHGVRLGGQLMASTDEGSDRRCVSCGRSIAMDANVCQYCGHDFRAPSPQAGEKKKGVLALVGGILLLLAAIHGLYVGLSLAVLSDTVSDALPADIDIATDVLEDIMTLCGGIIIVFALIAVLGAVMAIMRKSFGLAVIGSVFGILCMGGLFILPLIALILIVVGRDEFN